MPRKFKTFEHLLKPDPKFNSKLVSKFINCMMWDGKKTVAQKMFYKALDIIGKKIKDKEPLEVFTDALNNVKPLIEVRSKRIGGATYQVPHPVPPKRQIKLAITWIIQSARKKSGTDMASRLARELIATYRKDKESEALTTRENVHKMAEANKAFAHFAGQR